jgi:UDP-glucose 4-epimerase
VNVEATRKLIETAKSVGVRRVLLVSSAHVYGEEGENISEDVRKHPSGFYARSKLDVEEIALAQRSVGFEVVIVRPPLVYGPNARHNLLKMMHAIDRGRYFHLSRQNPIRSFLSTDNASHAIIHLLERGVDGCAYNLSDRYPYTLREFADSIAKEMGRQSPRTLPYGLVKVLAYCATPLTGTKLKPPLNQVSLRKITNNFTLDTNRLARTGFVWSGTETASLHDMVHSYLRLNH